MRDTASIGRGGMMRRTGARRRPSRASRRQADGDTGVEGAGGLFILIVLILERA